MLYSAALVATLAASLAASLAATLAASLADMAVLPTRTLLFRRRCSTESPDARECLRGRGRGGGTACL